MQQKGEPNGILKKLSVSSCRDLFWIMNSCFINRLKIFWVEKVASQLIELMNSKRYEDLFLTDDLITFCESITLKEEI